jgi:hypothetical protein
MNDGACRARSADIATLVNDARGHAHDRYESNDLGLGDELAVVVDAAPDRIARQPELGMVVVKPTARRTSVKQFGGSVYYVVEPTLSHDSALHYPSKRPSQ